jgi:hypothetical protein
VTRCSARSHRANAPSSRPRPWPRPPRRTVAVARAVAPAVAQVADGRVAVAPADGPMAVAPGGSPVARAVSPAAPAPRRRPTTRAAPQLDARVVPDRRDARHPAVAAAAPSTRRRARTAPRRSPPAAVADRSGCRAVPFPSSWMETARTSRFHGVIPVQLDGNDVSAMKLRATSALHHTCSIMKN